MSGGPVLPRIDTKQKSTNGKNETECQRNISANSTTAQPAQHCCAHIGDSKQPHEHPSAPSENSELVQKGFVTEIRGDSGQKNKVESVFSA